MFKIALILCLIVGIFQYTAATCGVCNANNGVACISKTKFHLCFEGKPDTSMTLECKNPNEICTKYGPICMDAGEVVGLLPACGDVSNCGKCEGKDDGVYACTSRTTFTMCMGGDLSEVRLTCPEHQMCNIAVASEGKYPCVPDCEEDKISFCDLPEAVDVPVTSTTQVTTTVSTGTTTTEMPGTTTVALTTTTKPSTTTTAGPTTTTAGPTTTTAGSITTTAVPATTTVSSTTTTSVPATTTAVPATTTAVPTTTTVATTTTTAASTTTTAASTTTEQDDTTTTVIFAPTPGSTLPTASTTLPPPTTTTELPTTTVTTPETTTKNPADVLCSQQTAVGRYPYPNDNTCRRYIFCYFKGNVMKSNTMNCPGDFYFDPSTTLCAARKPPGCI